MSEEKYRKDTPKYMVSEPGKMPYDSRLTEETIVRDDYVPKKDKIQFVEIYPMPTDNKSLTFELNRLDHEWQQNWFRDNGDLNIRIKKRKGDEASNDIILSQIQKYRNDLGEFHRNDETYKLAQEDFMRKDRERNELFHKRNDIRDALRKKTLRSISLDDANKLGWIIENDPKYKIHESSTYKGHSYVFANEYEEKWNGEKVILNDKPIWLGETVIVDENKKGGKTRKCRKMKIYTVKKGNATKRKIFRKNKKFLKYNKNKKNS